jgi:hypothetical protein
MKRPSILATSIITAAALLLPGCSDIPPGQPGPFANGAVAGGDLARAATVTSAESFATGSTAGTVASAAIVILAKHKISPHQRQVAVARAKVVIARMKTKRGKQPEIEARRMKPAVAKGEQRAKKLPRYIAVDTAKDERTVPQAAKSVVIFDTETQEVVGNNVYDVKSTPPVGGTAKFETYTAEYVGSGG